MRVTNAYESVYLFRPSAKCVPQTSSRMHFHHHPNKNAFSRWRLLSVMFIMMYSFRSSPLYNYEIILRLEYEIVPNLSRGEFFIKKIARLRNLRAERGRDSDIFLVRECASSRSIFLIHRIHILCRFNTTRSFL